MCAGGEERRKGGKGGGLDGPGCVVVGRLHTARFLLRLARLLVLPSGSGPPVGTEIFISLC